MNLTIEDNHRTDETIGEETIDAEIMVLEVTVEMEAEAVNYRRNFSNDRNSSRDRNRSRTRERSLTPRGTTEDTKAQT